MMVDDDDRDFLPQPVECLEQGLDYGRRQPLEGFAEALAMELEGTGVKVSVIEPGICNTDMLPQDIAVLETKKEQAPDYLVPQLEDTINAIKVLKPVRIENGRSYAELLPGGSTLTLDVEIAFDTALIGTQKRVFNLTPAGFRSEIAAARTFGFMRDVERLWKAGYALGASLENTVAIGEDKIVNPEGLRFSDEFVRHKILDAVGDLSLAGLPIRGTYRAFCPGHKLNFMMLEQLFADRSAYAIVEAGARREGVRELGHGELAAPLPAFGPTTR